MIRLRIKQISKLSKAERARLMMRSQDFRKVMPEVEEIIKGVKLGGDKALKRYTAKFDGVKLKELKVSNAELERASASLPENIIKALKTSIRNVEKFHLAQLPKDKKVKVSKGVTLARLFVPLNAVGIYIPGGKAAYPSTVLMASIPARLAGVNKIVLCTPPRKDGFIEPAVLAAAKLCGVTEIFKVGGAQAIAALAYGTRSIPKVDKIIGPGNVWVTAAKILVSSAVGIDFPCGPSEILIVADDSPRIDFIALDMLAQAEHDENAYAVLVTTSEKIAWGVKQEINKQIGGMGRKAIITRALEKNGIILLAKSLDEAVDFVNSYAPEHLEIMTGSPKKLLPRLKNVASVFLGEYAPVALGDYSSGSNHILPTSGYARIYPGLSVDNFLKSITYQSSSKKGLNKLAASAIKLARLEGLEAHTKSLERRCIK